MKENQRQGWDWKVSLHCSQRLYSYKEKKIGHNKISDSFFLKISTLTGNKWLVNQFFDIAITTTVINLKISVLIYINILIKVINNNNYKQGKMLMQSKKEIHHLLKTYMYRFQNSSISREQIVIMLTSHTAKI